LRVVASVFGGRKNVRYGNVVVLSAIAELSGACAKRSGEVVNRLHALRARVAIDFALVFAMTKEEEEEREDDYDSDNAAGDSTADYSTVSSTRLGWSR
jgi:hypothetical protein